MTLTSVAPGQVYLPALTSLDSCEGLPDFKPLVAHKTTSNTWKLRPHGILLWAGAVLPGICLAGVLAYAGILLSAWLGTRLLGFAESPLSPILLAVGLGLLLCNTVGIPPVYHEGLKLCVKTVLRLGIVLLGLRLSLGDLGKIGFIGLPVILGCIVTALFSVTLISRALKLPERLGALIAVGTSICGVSAILATGPAIDAEDDEMSYAVACITIFGMFSLFCYPYFAYWFFEGNAPLAGLFLGTAIHDTAQVAGAGLMYQQQYGSSMALDAAVTSKLVRNVCMAGLIPVMAILYHRRSTSKSVRSRLQWKQVVPLFIFGFIAMVLIRSAGDWAVTLFQGFSVSSWKELLSNANFIAGWCLALAMASVGLSTGFAKVRQLGWKPFSVGFAAALLVGAASCVLVKLLGPMM